MIQSNNNNYIEKDTDSHFQNITIVLFKVTLDLKDSEALSNTLYNTLIKCNQSFD